jgi:hypothetical protein
MTVATCNLITDSRKERLKATQVAFVVTGGKYVLVCVHFVLGLTLQHVKILGIILK